MSPVSSVLRPSGITSQWSDAVLRPSGENEKSVKADTPATEEANPNQDLVFSRAEGPDFRRALPIVELPSVSASWPMYPAAGRLVAPLATALALDITPSAGPAASTKPVISVAIVAGIDLSSNSKERLVLFI